MTLPLHALFCLPSLLLTLPMTPLHLVQPKQNQKRGHETGKVDIEPGVMSPPKNITS
jgi:hypothetical protein